MVPQTTYWLCADGEAKSMGIGRALVTIRNENEPSLRTALACGGIIEKVTKIRHSIWLDC